MSLACKIIATAFNPKRPIKGPQSWPHHGQVLNAIPLYHELVDKLIEIERTYDPGLPVDTFIMVYKDSQEAWKKWEEFHNTPTKTGTLYIVFQEEDGGCYQMYNNGYQMNKDKYDWFLFTCDDVCVFGDDYYVKIMAKWRPKAGYIALQGAGETHVQGSIGLTHKHVLVAVCDSNNGELPHPKGAWVQERNIHEGEIPFTGRMLGLGFEFVHYNESTTWHRDNLCFPYHNIKYGL